MNGTEVALLAGAGLFAWANGVNNGGALAALSTSITGLVPLVAIAMLSISLVVVPLTIGTRVAATLVSGIARWSPGDHLIFLAGVLVAVALVWALSRFGVPTSLTMATVGALTGAGLGAGLVVSAPTIGVVLAAGMLGPVVAGCVGRAIAARLGSRLAQARSGGWTSHLAFAAQAVAYSANDGQRMVAVLLVARSERRLSLPLPLTLIAISACFAIGAITGLWRVGPTLTRRVALPTSGEVLSAQLAALTASAFGYAIGAPISMTQSTTAGLVGARTRSGFRRVRWDEAGRLAMAWAVTLPTAFALGYLLARGLHFLGP